MRWKPCGPRPRTLSVLIDTPRRGVIPSRETHTLLPPGIPLAPQSLRSVRRRRPRAARAIHRCGRRPTVPSVVAGRHRADAIMTTLAETDARAGSQHRRGLLLVGGAAMVWSSGGPIARLIETDPWTTVFWRSVAAATALLLYIGIRERGRVATPFRQLGWPGLITALCFAAASTAFVVALRHTTVANILLIVATAPFIAGGLGWLLVGERGRRRAWCALAAAVAALPV